MVVRPEIKTVADLKGKAIGVSRAGTTTDYIAREIVRHLGLNPDRDITTLGLGDQSSRLVSLQAGTVHGAILDAPNDVKAESMGFRILAFSGDVLPDLLVGGSGNFHRQDSERAESGQEGSTGFHQEPNDDRR